MRTSLLTVDCVPGTSKCVLHTPKHGPFLISSSMPPCHRTMETVAINAEYGTQNTMLGVAANKHRVHRSRQTNTGQSDSLVEKTRSTASRSRSLSVRLRTPGIPGVVHPVGGMDQSCWVVKYDGTQHHNMKNRNVFLGLAICKFGLHHLRRDRVDRMERSLIAPCHGLHCPNHGGRPTMVRKITHASIYLGDRSTQLADTKDASTEQKTLWWNCRSLVSGSESLKKAMIFH